MKPVAKTKEDLTLAQNIGLSTFDAIQSMLKMYGAETQILGGPVGDSQTQRRG